MRIAISSLCLVALCAALAGPVQAQLQRSVSGGTNKQDARVAALEARVAALEAVLKRQGNNVTLQAPGKLFLRGGNGRDVELRGKNVRVEGQSALLLKAGASARLESGSQTLVKGGVVKVNGQRAATTATKVIGTCPPVGGPLVAGKLIP